VSQPVGPPAAPQYGPPQHTPPRYAPPPAYVPPPPPPPITPRRPRRLRTAVLVGLAAVALCLCAPSLVSALGGAFNAANGDAATDNAPGSRGYDQARAVEQVLIDSGRDRGRLNQGIQKVDACRSVGTGVAQIRQAQQGRQDQLTRVQALSTDAIPNGDVLKATLIEALERSLAADNAFLDWATNVRDTNCARSSKRNGAYAEGLRQSRLADDPKQRFVDLWNPIAVQFGLSLTNLTEGDV
jgi:hypothetical protein